ncbi:hypothetical protein FQR65_LT05427 [Abscondita terminalis]|nr:hypothetical protein FQR65_LT05427 [Abscondita terminalis]
MQHFVIIFLQVSDRKEPPLCVQNAMLTKDKKPFTYTPGGIDLSEIRSPRMARRLERNAMNEGVSSVPQMTHHPTGPLPPSALAAMQPQLSVQVFPTGGIPQSGPPPPPPPPKAPPMKTSPLPTDVFNRPDMTKIIPENPMALLRKTSGPVVKQDPILNKGGGPIANNVQNVESPQFRQPPTDPSNHNNYAQPNVQPKRQVSVESKPTAGVGSIYVPPIDQTKPAESPPATYTPPAYYKRQPSTPQPEPVTQPETPNSPKPSLSKAPTPWLTQRRQLSQDVPEWAVNDQRVQSPPAAQDIIQHQREESPKAKPIRPWQQQETQPRYPQQQPEAQQRYQQPEAQQRYQQPELQQRYQQPEAQQRYQQPETQQRYHQPNIQQRYQQEAQPQPQHTHYPYQQQPETRQRYQPQPQQSWQEQPQQQSQGGVRKQIQNKERPQEYYPPERTEVVIVNDPPQVYHHPGQRVITRQNPQHTYQQPRQDDGVRVIPVQIEGRSNGQVRSPNQGANSDARSFNRQLSWNSSPTQSNTFRVLQKITQTDGADDDNQIVIEHSPKMYQQFPQRQTSMDGRKWNQNDSDQAVMGTFKEGFDEGFTLQNEVDPRYRGPHIPSKAFKLLQSMTGGPDSSTSSIVPQAQTSSSGPKVRTIPIHVEVLGNGSTRTYVPPSEQTVQEPKKYTGSSIPSRSFKILQAMTAPDECVSPDQACENNENYSNDPSSYAQWGFDPNIPPPSPYCFDPYWSYYAQNYYPLNNDTPDLNQSNPRITPIPSPWNFYPPYYYGHKDKNTAENKRNQKTPVSWQNDENNKAIRAPTPSWPFYYSNENDAKKDTEADDQQNYMAYPPYWNPYYYNYYYGVPPPMYPPIYSPYPFYPPQSDNEEISGYSSNEEMAYYGARFASMPPFANNTPPQSKSNITQNQPKPEENKKDEVVKNPMVSDDDGETSDSDAEMVSYEVCRKTPGLQTIRSVSDIKVYDGEDSSQCSEDDSDNTTEENEDNSLCVLEDVIPHQLSVIFEESEKTDSARLDRESSVSTTISEGTATMENSEVEDEDADESDGTVFVKLPLTFKFVVAESQKVATLTVGNSEVVPQTAVRSSVEEVSCDKTKTDGSFNTLHLESNGSECEGDEVIEEEDQMNELKNSESGIDFWAHLNRDGSTTQIYAMSKRLACENTLTECAEEVEHGNVSTVSDDLDKRSSTISTDEEKSEIDFWAEINSTTDNNVLDKSNADNLSEDASSACSSDSSLSSSTASETAEPPLAEINSKEVKPPQEEVEIKLLTIQERIKSLQKSIASKKAQDQQDTDIKISIKERVSQLQDNQLTVEKTNSCSRKSSIKSYEGYSEEEEGDSGVTSDVSRHISEVETDLDFFENKKLNQYQRASTHSRLFKLLQDECDGDDEPDKVVETKTMTQRRDCLSLPLKQAGSDPESFSSSGFTSPGSPTINDKIVNEIIQNLIMKKQGRVFKNMTMEKLQAAALRILQEDMDGLETLSSSEDGGTFPRKGEISTNQGASVPQECFSNFNDYSQYYDSWNNAEVYYDGYDIVPSKAFKLLQEHSSTNRTGAIAGLLARCPRVLSNKNVQKELMKLIESQNSPTPSPEPPEQTPNVNEATSAS